MADNPNARYHDAFMNTPGDYRNAVDAVVAAVRKDDEGKTILRSSALGLKQTHAVFQEGKRAAARAIRADTDRAEWALNPQEHAARIAEGNTDHG